MGESERLGTARAVGAEEVFEAAQPLLAAALAHYRVPFQEAEDLIQETYLRFLRKRDEIRDPQRWLAGAIRKECQIYWRQRRHALWEEGDAALLELIDETAGEAAERAAVRSDLRRVIARLGARCQELLRLRYQLGYDSHEVSAQLGYDYDSVRMVVRRCVAALAEKLIAAGYRPETEP